MEGARFLILADLLCRTVRSRAGLFSDPRPGFACWIRCAPIRSSKDSVRDQLNQPCLT